MENNVKIELSVQVWNTILSILSQRPYAEVSSIIFEISKQADLQLKQTVKSDEIQ